MLVEKGSTFEERDVYIPLLLSGERGQAWVLCFVD